MALTDSDQRHLMAAEGFADLGLFLEANEELEAIDPEVRHVPEVLAIRLRIYQALGKWELMRTVAAKPILLSAVERSPSSAILQYNLACYECQQGEVNVAKFRLKHAFKLDPKLRLTALDDPDLKPLWGWIPPAG